MSHRILLKTAFDAAVEAVRAARRLPARFENGSGRIGMIALGKAGADMARIAFERLETPPAFALAVAPYGHVPPDMPGGVEVIEAGHPHPDEKSLYAGRRALELAAQLGPHDQLLALVSGGGSAVLCAPSEGVSFEEKRNVIAALHRKGAPIGEINAVRAALSSVKGGRLGAAANGAFIKTLIVSDIPGDAAGVVASGPTIAPDRSSDAEAVLRRYAINAPPHIAAALRRAPPAELVGSAKIIASADDALTAAAAVLEKAGYDVRNLGGALEGDAAELAQAHAEAAKRYKSDGGPTAIISGGETTVRLPETGAGRGGRNTTYLLALAIALNGRQGIEAMAADTDGVDGSADNAGAFIEPETLARAAGRGLDATAHLRRADAYAFFEALGDLLVTGPTFTNVNDLRIILIDP